ncbi:MAG: glycoside hydrolase family 47 protein [Deltaproteobacteria bacterium]|nr:glycoside hydrolase family 47 protein [Deltaproteobacteria bacterium]
MTSTRRPIPALAALLALIAAACSGSAPADPDAADATDLAGQPDTRPDAGADASPDASPDAETPPARDPAADTVRAELLHAWTGYRTHAWGHDEVRPLSGDAADWHGNGTLLVTPIDALDTLIVAGLDEQAADALELIATTFDPAIDAGVKAFEVNIRVLGGLLSAHQLTGDARLLAHAVALADRLLPAFDSPTGMPWEFVNLLTGETSGAFTNPAEAGTWALELGTLSRLTGDPRYEQRAKAAAEALFALRSPLGLIPNGVDVERGEPLGSVTTIGGGVDSWLESLWKASVLFDDARYRAMWDASIAPVRQYVGQQIRGERWYGWTNTATGALVVPLYGSLDAFFPGLLALSGYVDEARELHESSFRMWQLAGIEPEALNWEGMEIIVPSYFLRPEIMESSWHLHRVTGDARYRAMGKVMLDALIARCRTPLAYAELKSVVTGEQEDRMESFFLAETLKYLYLLMDDEAADRLDGWVFNTEAHPLQPVAPLSAR